MTPRIVDVEARTTTVLTAASDVFAHRGYNAATIEEIAHSAGIGKGTTYEYFASKQELFLAVVEHDWQRLVHEVDARAGQADGNTMDRLEEFSAAVMRSYRELQKLHPAAMEFMVSSGTSDACARLMRCVRGGLTVFRDRAAEIVRSGIERGELRRDVVPEVVGTVLIASLDGLLLQARHDPSMDPAGLWTSFLAVVRRGMAVERE